MTGIMMSEDAYVTGANLEWPINYDLSEYKANTLESRTDFDKSQSRNFLYWLKGFIAGSGENGLDAKQVKMIEEQIDKELTVASFTSYDIKDNASISSSLVDLPIC